MTPTHAYITVLYPAGYTPINPDTAPVCVLGRMADPPDGVPAERCLRLSHLPGGRAMLLPAVHPPDFCTPWMRGPTFAVGTCPAWEALTGVSHPLPIHNYTESWHQYRQRAQRKEA